MDQPSIIYFDIAAVVVTFICICSLVIRHKTTGPVRRVYLSCMMLVLFTSLTAVLAESLDPFISHPSNEIAMTPEVQLVAAREVLTVLYYALRCLTAPAYLVLIAVISDTSHLLNKRGISRLLLWVPMLATVAFVLTNPLHHLVFSMEDGRIERHSFIAVVYIEAVYYSLIGIGWLIRWREILDRDTFATLMALYPIVFSFVTVQYSVPALRVDMFVTSIVLMLVSAFVLRPEIQQDSLVDAASLQAYREMCRRVFATKKRLCLVYLEIVNMERMRELVGQDELQNIVRMIAANLSRTLESGDTLYYLRNGLFCISPRNIDVDHALRVALQTHEEGRARARKEESHLPVTEMRTCIVRVPEDVSDIDTLKSFVRRFGHLVPTSTVTTYVDLSRQKDFKLHMALSDVVARAIRERSFEVHYQPIRCLEDDRFHSAEALVRLRDPEFGPVPPSLFIPEAEQSGAIVAVGAILMEKIFAFLGRVDYEATGLHYVEANLSVDQCIRPHLAHMLIGFAQEYDVNPARINLEVTETSSAFSRAIIEQNVRALAAAGFTFSLDDYGTGYSNVTRALTLPFSIIKFDKAFVDDMDNPATSTVLARSIAMMHEIGKKVLVEGVETEEQASQLRAMGADYIQGFLYAKPLPEADFVAFLEERNG